MVQHRAIALLLGDRVALWGRSLGQKSNLFLAVDVVRQSQQKILKFYS
jgi:hypothetical protein